MASMGMALGFMAGSMISATLLSPWLDGWRNVLILLRRDLNGLQHPLVFHAFTPRRGQWFNEPEPFWLVAPDPSACQPHQKCLADGIAILLLGGCIQGVLGYLPYISQNRLDRYWRGRRLSHISWRQYESVRCRLPSGLTGLVPGNAPSCLLR